MCIDSFLKTNTPLSRLVVVDNGSHDGTIEYLKSIPLGGIIQNSKNYGCGVAWNQGALYQQAEWTIIMNNDVLVSDNWIKSLITTAEINKLKIISPALIEGPMDYDFIGFLKHEAPKMNDVIRTGKAHAVCLAVHESVWMDIGFFRPTPNLWGFEDTLFFHAAKKALIPIAITGSSWLHHFGSITQSRMKKERNMSITQDLTGRFNYKLLNETWIERKLRQFKNKKSDQFYRENELEKYGITLHGIRKAGRFEWI
jgi:GT2 family glycosyltransferase